MVEQLYLPPVRKSQRLKPRREVLRKPDLDVEVHDLESLAKCHIYRLRGVSVNLDEGSLDRFLCITRPQQSKDEPEVGQPFELWDWQTGLVDIQLAGGKMVTLPSERYWVLVKRVMTMGDWQVIAKFGDTRFEYDFINSKGQSNGRS